MYRFIEKYKNFLFVYKLKEYSLRKLIIGQEKILTYRNNKR